MTRGLSRFLGERVSGPHMGNLPKTLLFLGVISVGFGCSRERVDSKVSSDRAPIAQGEVDQGHPAVVAIAKRRVRCHEPFVESFCTGVLIADRVVLTAAHCALAETALDIEVFVGDDVNSSTGHYFSVAEQRVHPEYDPDTFENDLALLLLDKSPGVTPVALAAGDAPTTGATVQVVGFGGEGNGSDGIKRRGTSVITAVEPTIVRTEPSPSLACGGDSGAPVFLDGPDPRMIGIVRSGDATCQSFTNATRVDTYLDGFIQPFVTAPPTPSRISVSLEENRCSVACGQDDDCPRGMLCLPERELGTICGYAEMRSGVISGECSEDTDCASGYCAASGPGDEGRVCGCFTTCTELAATSTTPSAKAEKLEIVGGCGVVTGSPRARSTRATLTALAGLLVAMRWRRRTSESSLFFADRPRSRR